MAVEELSAPPRLGRLYRSAVAGAARGAAGAAAAAVRRRPASADAALPEVELVLPEVRVDVDHLAAYDRVCGFRLTDALPVTYPHVLGFPLALALMTRRDFPLPLPGLVHVANRIEVLAPLTTADRLTLRVRALGLRPHPRGRQVDLVTEVHLDGACAWREHSTYLRRQGGERSDRPAAPPATSPPGTSPPAAPPAGGARWTVPADTGIRYARVSGDRNPIHTSRLAARLFGFPGRIAHGMWTAARSLAALEGRVPDLVTAETRFQRPVPLPARVTFAATAAGSGWSLALTDATGRPHLTGTVSPTRPA